MDIPYIISPGKNACALACHQMTAKSFFPDISVADVARLCRWEEGYVVWAFPFWLWMMDRGVKITEIDGTDYKAWAEEGIPGLERTFSPDSFEFISEWTKDLDIYTDEIRRCFAHPNFTNIHRNATMADLKQNLSPNAVCEIVLDSRTLERREGFALHRIVALSADDQTVSFHDPVRPGAEPRPNRMEDKAHFQNAFYKGGELCVYSL